MLVQLVLSTVLAIVVSAMCSVAEAALYSIPLSHVEVLAKSGSRTGIILKRLKNDINQPITAILTLNTIANTMGAAVAGASVGVMFGDMYLAYFSALFTLSILFFSEIIPKTAGVTYCKELGPIIAYPLLWLVTVSFPLVWLCRKVTSMIEKNGRQDFVSAMEVQAIANLSHEAGEINSQEEKIIINILELKNRTVRKAMTPRTVTFTLPADLTVAEAGEMKDKWNLHSRVPVYDSDPDDIVGIVMRKNVLLCAAEDRHEVKLKELMEPAHFVPEAAPLPNILLEFFEERQHLFIVVDEYGAFTGVISMEDIIEEIMGEEIMDESDKTRDMRALARFKRLAARAGGISGTAGGSQKMTDR